MKEFIMFLRKKRYTRKNKKLKILKHSEKAKKIRKKNPFACTVLHLVATFLIGLLIVNAYSEYSSHSNNLCKNRIVIEVKIIAVDKVYHKTFSKISDNSKIVKSLNLDQNLTKTGNNQALFIFFLLFLLKISWEAMPVTKDENNFRPQDLEIKKEKFEYYQSTFANLPKVFTKKEIVKSDDKFVKPLEFQEKNKTTSKTTRKRSSSESNQKENTNEENLQTEDSTKKKRGRKSNATKQAEAEAAAIKAEEEAKGQKASFIAYRDAHANDPDLIAIEKAIEEKKKEELEKTNTSPKMNSKISKHLKDKSLYDQSQSDNFNTFNEFPNQPPSKSSPIKQNRKIFMPKKNANNERGDTVKIVMTSENNKGKVYNECDKALEKYINANAKVEGWNVDKKGNIFLYPSTNQDKTNVLENKDFFPG
jgi:hypothetical protein